MERHGGGSGEGVRGERNAAKVGRRARLLISPAGRGQPARHSGAPPCGRHLLLHLAPRSLLLAAPCEGQRRIVKTHMKEAAGGAAAAAMLLLLSTSTSIAPAVFLFSIPSASQQLPCYPRTLRVGENCQPPGSNLSGSCCLEETRSPARASSAATAHLNRYLARFRLGDVRKSVAFLRCLALPQPISHTCMSSRGRAREGHEKVAQSAKEKGHKETLAMWMWRVPGGGFSSGPACELRRWLEVLRVR